MHYDACDCRFAQSSEREALSSLSAPSLARHFIEPAAHESLQAAWISVVPEISVRPVTGNTFRTLDPKFR